MARMIGMGEVEIALDIGAGMGRDLALVRSHHPNAELHAVEFWPPNVAKLKSQGVSVYTADIERDALPLSDGSLDLIVANQVLEHTKEVFWVFHEMTRCLRPGASLIMGVPNVASLHNRLLLLIGRHPTQHKLASAHVRPFSRRDTLAFLEACFPGGYELTAFAGAQFYPFPGPVARRLAGMFPTLAFSIFLRLTRTREPYRGSFLRFPAEQGLETNFWTGQVMATALIAAE